MNARTHQELRRLSNQTRDLAVAAPHVVALRLNQFAAAGNTPNQRDVAEFTQMIVEKQTAFFQAWSVMMLQTMIAQQSMSVRLWEWSLSPLRGNQQAASLALWNQMQNSTLTIANKSLKPISSKAVANAKRLSRS
ncbi:hypothetical protein SAMN02745117_02313 [Lampropedia hyalina DSM 16112]|jgi:hypothetical protein|uniref:Phasin protein n=1 Tax=Lampropedia hyalina DSM 16112 TaxID=1122156 RepID=A0A1M5D5Z0_9BURK|nr:polyhydroxyalkanoate granule-associated phasin [Lampropedia hyalina]SHF62404.1 hypothetical protein SAMN02745117_02313 [Lampropedia hyalina DSM 16112]